MKDNEKMEWIINYIKKSGCKSVDIFTVEFVNAYVQECKPKKVNPRMWGGDNVPELGRILSEMYKRGLLWRTTMGAHYTQDGFPKWFYVYFLN